MDDDCKMPSLNPPPLEEGVGWGMEVKRVGPDTYEVHFEADDSRRDETRHLAADEVMQLRARWFEPIAEAPVMARHFERTLRGMPFQPPS